MLRTLLKKHGVGPVVLCLTSLSILGSLLITVAINYPISGTIEPMGIFTATIAPALLSPLLSTYYLRLLHQLIQAEDELHRLSITDPLTGVPNRRHFLELAQHEVARTQRYGVPLSIAILDVDAFKAINDRYGHLAGDQVLRELATLCQSHVRESDLFARFGGEEFIVLFTEAGKEEAWSSAERLRQLVAARTFHVEGAPLRVTVSTGVATYGGAGLTLDELLRQADSAMYAAKRLGGNRVLAVPESGTGPEPD